VCASQNVFLQTSVLLSAPVVPVPARLTARREPKRLLLLRDGLCQICHAPDLAVLCREHTERVLVGIEGDDPTNQTIAKATHEWRKGQTCRIVGLKDQHIGPEPRHEVQRVVDLVSNPNDLKCRVLPEESLQPLPEKRTTRNHEDARHGPTALLSPLETIVAVARAAFYTQENHMQRKGEPLLEWLSLPMSYGLAWPRWAMPGGTEPTLTSQVCGR